jgi:hypothetical protein
LLDFVGMAVPQRPEPFLPQHHGQPKSHSPVPDGSA